MGCCGLLGERAPLLPDDPHITAQLHGCLVFVAGESAEVASYRLSDAQPPALVPQQTISIGEGSRGIGLIVLHPRRERLYAFSSHRKAMSNAKASDARHGEMVVYSINRKSGHLTQQNIIDTMGHQPCSAACTPDGSLLAVAHYLDGHVCLFELSAAGDPNLVPTRVLQLPWKGTVVAEEARLLDGLKGPMCRGIAFSPPGQWILACDVGQDRVVAFGLAPLCAMDVAITDVADERPPPGGLPCCLARKLGQRPRHLVFHPSGRFVYVLFEGANYVRSYAFDEAQGTLGEALQEIAVLETGSCSLSAYLCCFAVTVAAELHLLENRESLLVSSWGHCAESLLTMFSLAGDGTLAVVHQTSSLGHMPRHFMQHNGLLVVGLEQECEVAVFHSAAGSLRPVAKLPLPEAASGPQCVQVWEPFTR